LTPRAVAYHPYFEGPTRYTIEERPNAASDEANTGQTIARMAAYARDDSTSPIVRRAAHEAARGFSDPAEIAGRVHSWIRSTVRFVEDAELAHLAGIPPAPDTEVLIRPVDILTMATPAGDCDDFSMLTAAMLRALGIEASYKTVEADDTAPGLYSHVYTVAHLPAGALAIDSSHGPWPGWEVEPTGKSKLWPIEAPRKTMSSIRTLGALGDDPPAPVDPGLSNEFLQTFMPIYTPAVPVTDPAGGILYTTSPIAGSTPPFMGTPGAGFNWESLLNTGLTDAAGILGTRYAVPQLAPGQTISTTKDGTFMTQLPTGATQAVTAGLSMTTLLLIVGGIIFAVYAFKQKA
jgi:hypothetical protein